MNLCSPISCKIQFVILENAIKYRAYSHCARHLGRFVFDRLNVNFDVSLDVSISVAIPLHANMRLAPSWVWVACLSQF